jgi:ATP-dependent DNA ligase
MFSIVTPRLRFIEPQLASPIDQPPTGKHWIHELKHDGYRCQVLVEGGQARVLTRNGHDWSDRYPSIVRAAASQQGRERKYRHAQVDTPATGDSKPGG